MHQKMVVFIFLFFEKTIKEYLKDLKVVMLSLKIYESILKFYFLGGIRHIDCFHGFLKRSFIDIKNNEVS